MSLTKIGLIISLLVGLFFAVFFAQAYNAEKDLTERTLVRHYALQRAINDFYCHAPRAVVSCDNIMLQIEQLTTKIAEETSPLEKARLSVNRRRLQDQLTPLTPEMRTLFTAEHIDKYAVLRSITHLHIAVSEQLASHGMVPPNGYFEQLMHDKQSLDQAL